MNTQYTTQLKNWYNSNRLLTIVGIAHLVMLVGFIAGAIFDPRTLTGQPLWMKPAKFAISIGIYSLTLLWMVTYIEGKQRLVKVVTTITAVGFSLETLAIVVQALRGVRSHFNMATPFDAAVFSVMGGTIGLVTAMLLVVAVLLIIQKKHDVAFRWSLILGLIITFVGSYIAFTMTANAKPDQLATIESGEAPTEFGGHAVGAPDEAAGLPILGWSTQGGDLRVSHFFGIHALQVLPLIGWLATRRRIKETLTDAGRTALVFSGGFTYLGMMLVLYWQALRGQSVISPDLLTLTVFQGVMILSLAGVVLALVIGKRKQISATKQIVPVQ